MTAPMVLADQVHKASSVEEYVLLIEAVSDAQAAELARSCPVFEYDGSVEVRPIMEREM